LLNGKNDGLLPGTGAEMVLVGLSGSETDPDSPSPSRATGRSVSAEVNRLIAPSLVSEDSPCFASDRETPKEPADPRRRDDEIFFATLLGDVGSPRDWV
jgi:hypothetical protein